MACCYDYLDANVTLHISGNQGGKQLLLLTVTKGGLDGPS